MGLDGFGLNISIILNLETIDKLDMRPGSPRAVNSCQMSCCTISNAMARNATHAFTEISEHVTLGDLIPRQQVVIKPSSTPPWSLPPVNWNKITLPHLSQSG